MMHSNSILSVSDGSDWNQSTNSIPQWPSRAGSCVLEDVGSQKTVTHLPLTDLHTNINNSSKTMTHRAVEVQPSDLEQEQDEEANCSNLKPNIP